MIDMAKSNAFMEQLLTAEQGVLGSMLIDENAAQAMLAALTDEDFHVPENQEIFRAFQELCSGGAPPDAIQVNEHLGGGMGKYLSVLMDLTPTAANADEYARLLRDASQLWKLKELAESIELGICRREEPGEIITAAAGRLWEIEQGGASGDLADQKAAWDAFLSHRSRVESGHGAVPTGFEPLDDILGGGMLRSGLYILAARPGMGKTTAALQFADSIAEHTGPVLFVSLEMALEQIEGKRIARLSGIPSNEVLLGDGAKMDYRKIMEAGKALRKLPVYVSRRASATVPQIRRMARQVEGLQCVVVDYLGKIAPRDRKASLYEAITAISGDLKTLAVELGVPVLCLAQLNRANTERQEKRPQMSDLRDSGAIEQDADGVIMLHRADYYEMNETPLQAWENVELEIIVRKNRHGRIGSCTAGFFPATGKIVKRR